MNNQSLFGARLDDAQKWLSSSNGPIHLLICYGFKNNEVKSKVSSVNRNSPVGPTVPLRVNGSTNGSNNGDSISPRMISPIYANTTKQMISPQPPPVPAKPNFRLANNSENQKKSTQNGHELDEVCFLDEFS